MTSTSIVQDEIARFLKSSEPEVLCITGDWGVGKTYTWTAALDRARRGRQIGLSRYSYVSLFGIGSLEAMKSAIFENLEFLTPEGSAGFDWLISGGNAVFKNSKRLVGLAGSIPKVGDLLAKSQPFLFASVRGQIVCVDDLDRRGNVAVSDVLGLVSFLREQRSCKIVLLLNQSKLSEDAASEFEKHFEKVIDSKLVFAPTSKEAAAIAIVGSDTVSGLIREHCERLEIANIRVIKKIERLIAMVSPLVEHLGNSVRTQTVHSLVMFGWSKFDTGSKPPSFSYLKESEMTRYLGREESREAASEDEARWDAILETYGWGIVDDYDYALAEFVSTGVLRSSEVVDAATSVVTNQKDWAKRNAHRDSWRLYHDSFALNEDAVSESLVAGIKCNLDVLSAYQLDATVSTLRHLDRDHLADEIIDFAEASAKSDFWLSDDPMRRPIHEVRIREIVHRYRSLAEPKFNFPTDLVNAAQSMSATSLEKLARVPVAEYQALFESKVGDELKIAVSSALEYRKISNATEDMKAIVKNAESALRNIGAKSKLNALRVKKYGVNVEDAG